MNKVELIEAMAEKSGLKKTQCSAALQAFVSAVQEELKKDADNKVQIVGFGTFGVSKRAARVGRNPHTGEEIKIAASLTPSFKAGKAFKDALN